MKKTLLIILSLLLSGTFLLSGCTDTVIVELSDATTINTYIDEASNWGQVKLNNEGIIDINGEGSFYYKLIDDYDNDIDFHGITFIPDYASYLALQGQYVLGSIIYYILAEFEDGTSEVLYDLISLDCEVNIDLYEHNNIHFGVMQIRNNDTGERYTYLLVSVTE